MFVKTSNIVTYFKNESAKNTDKMFTGRVSIRIKNGEGDDGKPNYSYDSWNARFVGKAKSVAEALGDKTVIILKEFTVRCPYDKEKNKEYPYIVVYDCEIYEKKEDKNDVDG